MVVSSEVASLGKKEERVAATSLSPTPNTTIAEQRPSPAQRILVMVDNRALQRALLRLFSLERDEVEIVTDDLVGLEMLRKSPLSWIS